MNYPLCLGLFHAVKLQRHEAGHKGQRIVYSTNPYKKVQETLKLVGMSKTKVQSMSTSIWAESTAQYCKLTFVTMSKEVLRGSFAAFDAVYKLQWSGVWPGLASLER